MNGRAKIWERLRDQADDDADLQDTLNIVDDLSNALGGADEPVTLTLPYSSAEQLQAPKWYRQAGEAVPTDPLD